MADKNISVLNQELKRIASIVADNDNEAAILIEETKKEALNAIIPIKSERRLLKLLAKQVEKQPSARQKNSMQVKFTAGLSKVDKQGRLLLVLHYYKGYSIQKSARIMGYSEKEAKQMLMDALMQWTSGQTGTDLQQLKQQLHKDLAYIEDMEEPPEFKRPFHIKRFAPIITFLLVLLIGGAGSQALKAKAEVNPGIDIMDIFKESIEQEEALDEVRAAIANAGYQDVYFSVDSNAEYAYLEIEGKDNEAKQEEIKSLVEAEMQKRNIDFFMETNFYIPEESPPMEEVEMDEETAISNEILEKINNQLSKKIMDKFEVNSNLFYPLFVSWSTDAWSIEIPEEIGKKQEAEDITQAILDEYKDDRKLFVEEYRYKDHEQAYIWGDVVEYINTALASSEKYTFKAMFAEPDDGVMKFDVRLYLLKEDKDAEIIAREVKRSITRFLETSEIKEISEDNPYEIIVRDNKNKEIETD
ncbi:hypothetical protein CEQ21_23905 [Niallia circulans]|uniref:Uncharacterized protein n=1 Tax=Niallia circulans TaxID=1397 RepID=A0A553SN68_NIACI|nr:hypothetical protein [Niallia circulans]TRZ38439.1 hypothetical protein CEQ21_23905 [Niallia circulans]